MRSADLISLAAGVESRKTGIQSVAGQLADTPTRGLPTRGLDKWQTGQLADTDYVDIK